MMVEKQGRQATGRLLISDGHVEDEVTFLFFGKSAELKNIRWQLDAPPPPIFLHGMKSVISCS
jgi:hypothetical protein